MSVRSALPLEESRTAQALMGEVAATSWRPLEPLGPPGLGLCCTLHVLPFQCSTSVRDWLPLFQAPTAQALVGEVAATLTSLLPK